MNPGIEYYRPFGRQASATLVVKEVPTGAAAITIAGTTYTYGVSYTGRNVYEVAESLTAAINGDRNRQDLSMGLSTNPVGNVFAIYYGKTVRVIAAEPGVVGNALLIESYSSTFFTASAFTGGTDAAAISVAPATGSFSMEQTQPTVEYYRAFGNQASSLVTVASVPSVGATVTFGGTVFTMGTQFTGTTTAEVAESLMVAINSNPTRNVYAVYYSGTTLYVVATEPGTAGNAIATASSSAAITVPGAFLTLGTDLCTPAIFNTALVAVVTPGTPVVLGGATRVYQLTVRAYKAARTKNVGTVYVQFSAAATQIAYDLEPGESQVITAPDGTYFTLAQLWVDAVNAADGVSLIYITS